MQHMMICSFIRQKDRNSETTSKQYTNAYIQHTMAEIGEKNIEVSYDFTHFIHC